MEEYKSVPENANLQTFKRITLESQKYSVTYKLVCSEKFIRNISNLSNTVFTNIIKSLKEDVDEKNNNHQFGNKCLLTSKLHEKFNESALLQQSYDSHKDLIKEIETSLLTSDFGDKLLLGSNDQAFFD